MEVKIAKPSAAQMRKLHMGQPFRAKMDPHGITVHVPVAESKKLLKAQTKGMGATLHGCSCCGCQMCGKGGDNFVSTAKDSGKRLMVAGTDRAVSAIEGSGVFNQAKKKGESKAKKALHGGAGENFVSTAKDSGKRLMVSGTDRAVRAIEGSGWTSYDPNKPSSYSGGKINRLKKFNKWFKSIGTKVKTLNHNLKPIKEAATARAADYITMYNNPQAQAQAAIDMGQQEYRDTAKLGKKRHAAPGSASVPDSSSLRMNIISPIQSSASLLPQAVDINDDGEPDGYFYPNEAQYFGAGMKKKRGRGNVKIPPGQIAIVRDVRGTGRKIKMTGEEAKQQRQYFKDHPVAVHEPGSGLKKTSPWIAHVKKYAAEHHLKYGEALKAAKASYKSGKGHPKGPGFAASMFFKDTAKGTDYYRKKEAKWKKDHGHGPNTDAKVQARKDYWDQYYHRGAYSDAAIHNRNVAAAKEKAAQTAQANQAVNKAVTNTTQAVNKAMTGMGAKKTSPWIAHVKKYAAEHGMKYGEALKAAKASYKKGGAMLPAGMTYSDLYY